MRFNWQAFTYQRKIRQHTPTVCLSCLRLCHDLPSSPGKCSYWPPKYCDWLWRSWAAILIGSLYHSLSAGGERGPGMRRSSWLDNLIAYWVDGCLPDTVTRNLSEQQKEDFFRAVTAPTTQPIPSDFSKLKLSDIALSLSVCNCSYPAHPKAACTCPSCLCLVVSIVTVGGLPWIVPLWALAFGHRWSPAFAASLAPGKSTGLVTVSNTIVWLSSMYLLHLRIITQAEAEGGGKEKRTHLKFTYLAIEKKFGHFVHICIFTGKLGMKTTYYFQFRTLNITLFLHCVGVAVEAVEQVTY